MSTDITRRLGYGGSATIGDTGSEVQVLITGGNLDQADNPSFLEMMDIPPNTDSRSRVLHADGTSVYSGSLSFDITKAALPLFAVGKLFQRGYKFNVGINDGENYSKMIDCKLTSLTVSGAPGGFLNASVSFMSATARSNVLITNNYILGTTDNTPLGYWWSGGADIRDWTLTMNQAVEPMYGNQNIMTPKYLKTGLIDFSLDVNLYVEHVEPTGNSITIATSSFTLTGVTTARGHRFNGITDLGTYSHNFITAPNLGTSDASGVIIT